MVSGDGERGGKVLAGKGQLRARCRMVYDRAAMQPRLKFGCAFSNVMQQTRKLRICFRTKAGSKPLRQRGGSTQMLCSGLLSAIFGNMRKIVHLNLRKFVGFASIIL